MKDARGEDASGLNVRIEAYRSSAMLTAALAAESDITTPHGGGSPETPATFWAESGIASRNVVRRHGESTATVVAALVAQPDGPLDVATADGAWLRSSTPPDWDCGSQRVGVVDLFAGCGGLSYGVAEAIRAVGSSGCFIGVDLDPIAIATYQRNLASARGLVASVADVFDGTVGGRATSSERALAELAGETTFLLGGPPCQGHSAFNNRTRHSDERNALYLTMVRAAEILQPEYVVIENVPGALRDRSGVVQRSLESLARLGYEVDHQIADMSRIGVPQLRKRLVAVASRTGLTSIADVLSAHKQPVRDLRWAMGDLEDTPARPLDEPCASAPQTRRRIDVLFDQELWDLPNSHRPECHAHGDHSYRSIYGRLRWEQPAQTITTGFYSMCMGRNVHPSRRRTLTAHEAARIQFIPDAFDFSPVPKRTDLARLIGNAVPPKLGYVLALELLR